MNRDEKNTPSSRWLAAIPVATGVVCVALMFPRATPPTDVPLPVPDRAALRAATMTDDAIAAAQEHTLLSPNLRALGSAMRQLRLAESAEGAAHDTTPGRQAVDRTFQVAEATEGAKGVLELRAVQLHIFLRELARFEATGTSTPELQATGGTFLQRALSAGLLEGHRVLLTDDERRVLWKQWFNTVLRRQDDPKYRLSLDEQRVLYAIFLGHPRPAEDRRLAIEKELEGPHDDASCRALAKALVTATEDARLSNVAKLAAVDPDYPAAYARGVIDYRRGRFDLAATAFETWIHEHPDGPFSFRARNHLLAALRGR